MGIRGSLLHWFTDYLSDRYQRVTLDGFESNWGHIRAGVPQGSVLGPLLFLVYINDITAVVTSQIRLFADDTTLYITVDNDNVEQSRKLNQDLHNIKEWADQWLVTFNATKTKTMTASWKHSNDPYIPLLFDDTQLGEVKQNKHLGLLLSDDLSWSAHINDICIKANKRIDILCRLKNILDRRSLEIMYNSFVSPIIEYGNVVWPNCTKNDERNIAYNLRNREDLPLYKMRTETFRKSSPLQLKCGIICL